MINKMGLVIYVVILVVCSYLTLYGDSEILIKHAAGEYSIGDGIENFICVKNESDREMQLYIQCELWSDSGEVIDTKIDSFVASPYEETIHPVTMSGNETMVTGRYGTKITVWDEDPQSKNAKILKESTMKDSIVFFREQENFDQYAIEKWSISDKYLGRTLLKKDNVFIQDGILKIKLPPGELSGGEVYSVNDTEYGIYEIRMKLPNVGSSITGFFLYSPPDFYHEIDMEIANDSSGTLWLTTYAEGEVSNSTEYPLGFDPTESFHDYCFEYSKDRIQFFVDDKLVHTFTDRIPEGNMKLMVNCWYPDWRGLRTSTQEEELLIDWIKY